MQLRIVSLEGGWECKGEHLLIARHAQGGVNFPVHLDQECMNFK